MKPLYKFSLTGVAIAAAITFAVHAFKTLYNGLADSPANDQPRYAATEKSKTGKTYSLEALKGTSSWRLMQDGVEIATAERDPKGLAGDFRITSSATPSLAPGMRFSFTLSGQPGGIFYVCDCMTLSQQLERSPDGMPTFWTASVIHTGT